MPIPKQDHESGAIIFYPTALELDEQNRRQRLEEKEKEVDRLLEKLREKVGE